ncbi:hypothetical protein FB451DRAFT_1377730 [Mycena latifolia]|nr:hypothetical protein FB451DRAFT_1377730 [Mycena latifolia]
MFAREDKTKRAGFDSQVAVARRGWPGARRSMNQRRGSEQPRAEIGRATCETDCCRAVGTRIANPPVVVLVLVMLGIATLRAELRARRAVRHLPRVSVAMIDPATASVGLVLQQLSGRLMLAAALNIISPATRQWIREVRALATSEADERRAADGNANAETESARI